MKNNKTTRREFLGQASCAAVGSTAFASTLLNLFLTSSASAQSAVNGSEYRAIICLFLPGGNDSFNFVVPRGTNEYAEYAQVRGDLALPATDLLPISPLNAIGKSLGLHPGVPELQGLFQQGKLAIMANVGSLVRPTTKLDYQSGRSLPYGLFSHSDQQEQWQTSIPDERKGVGWGGRMADLLFPANTASPVSMNISISGNNLFQVGRDVVPYVVDQWGALRQNGYRDGSAYDSIRSDAIDNMVAESYDNALERTFNRMRVNARDAYSQFQAATAVGLPANVTFPDNGLGRSLRQVASIIAGRNVLGVKRQVFYVQWGGWDFHDNVIDNMRIMMPIVSSAIKAFYDATVAMGISNQVTLFTASDFGRSLTSNAKGSDHAWGGNQIVVGGAVRGQRVYGQYPDLFLGSPLDTGRGNLIPTLSVDQYAAELALWLGVDRSNLEYVLPNISRFYNVNSSSAPVGFLV
jgi:uncharacterized protein (DUF1501 family)